LEQNRRLSENKNGGYNMPNAKLAAWEHTYRSARKNDQRDILLDHLDLLGIDANPELLFEGTIKLVKMSAAYLSMGRSRHIDAFLSMQGYNPPLNPEAPYIFTFDLCGKAYARAFVGKGENMMIDLADLFGSPWEEYKVAGYYEFIISRADLKPLLVKEVKSLISMVKDDLYYDYSKDELEIDFTEYSNRSCLQVALMEKP
jgi:hypothetical protein